jgi:GTPase
LTGAEPAPTRAGHVALVGRPNAGKSSLLNRLLDEPLSIVTAKAQTTRRNVVGIDTHDGVQAIYLDAPGLVDPAYLLHEAMLEEVRRALEDADVTVMVVDAAARPPDLSEEQLALVRRSAGPLVIALNKVDAATPDSHAAAEAWAQERFQAPVLPVSAETGEGVDALRAAIAERLPESPFYYPEDELSTQPVRELVAEFVREAAFEALDQEVPYGLVAEVDEYREGSRPLYIRATMYVERRSQKGIVVGREGAQIRAIGTAARQRIEGFLGEPVYLDLWVKVLPRWRKDAEALRRFGFSPPKPDK